MSPTSSQQWARRIRYSDQHIRVSDAERNAVAERLAAHYGDGRLDQAEFDERVSRAMTAKTRGDLDGHVRHLARLRLLLHPVVLDRRPHRGLPVRHPVLASPPQPLSRAPGFRPPARGKWPVQLTAVGGTGH